MTPASLCLKTGLLCILLSLTGGGYPMAAITFNTPENLKIIPKPRIVKPSGGTFTVTSATVIIIPREEEEVASIGRYLAEEIRKLTGYTLTVREASRGASAPGTIEMTTGGADKTLGNEGYTMKVTGASVVISAPQPAGIFYGIQTLRQILMTGTVKQGKPLTIPCVHIEDTPRYPWRGMLLDCSRHFMTKEFVKRYIDLLAYHKMNVLHWHLTDDQGWRLEIKRYPRLTEIGAWRGEGENRHGGYYTQEDVEEIVVHARTRYVTIVPEIEMPGHATAALASYPEFSCTGEPVGVETTWGIKTNLFCAGKEETFEFLENVLGEVCELFPSPYIHIGGDEAKKDKWEACHLCQKRIRGEDLKDEHELQGYFTRRIDAFMQTLNRRIIGWDEILEGGPSRTAVVQSWRGMKGAIEGTRAGHHVISSPYTHTYFDFPIVDDGTTNDWYKVTTLEKAYSFDPVPEELTPDEAVYIMGGECAMWTENALQSTVDQKVFPRLCAFCEAVWTSEELRSWPDFAQRMEVHYKRLKKLGVDYFQQD